jgi:hypothetical protein
VGNLSKSEKELKIERFTIGLEDLDLEKIFRVGDKVSMLIDKKLKNPIEKYLLVKMLLISFEESAEFVLSPQDETKLRAFCHDESLDEE